MIKRNDLTSYNDMRALTARIMSAESGDRNYNNGKML
jgi:hypothetical protein